jgi:Ala-tRNA(Pro) deacylase
MAKKSKLPQKLVKRLENAGVKHEILEHKTVYTAYDAAMTLKRKLEDIAKSLLVKADKDYYLVLIPADHNLDFGKLAQTIKKAYGKDVKVVKIPGEKIMEEALKIKNGTVAAFGSIYDIPVIMEAKLAKAKKIVLSSGSFNHSVEMAAQEFAKLENAVTGAFGVKKKAKKNEGGKKKKPAAKKAKKPAPAKKKITNPAKKRNALKKK